MRIKKTGRLESDEKGIPAALFREGDTGYTVRVVHLDASHTASASPS